MVHEAHTHVRKMVHEQTPAVQVLYFSQVSESFQDMEPNVYDLQCIRFLLNGSVSPIQIEINSHLEYQSKGM